MRKNITKTGSVTVGLDLGDKYSRLCVLDELGEVVEESRVTTTPKALRQRFGITPCRVALEVGTHSPWVSRLLEELGHEVVVANPTQVRLISRSHRKTDQMDAETLARLARLDPRLLFPVRHRNRKSSEDLTVLRSRRALVAARTQLVNHVRGVVKSQGGRLPASSTRGFPRRAAAGIPTELRPVLTPVLAMISMLTRQILRFDRNIEQTAQEDYPHTALLRQVPGVGPLTALTYVLTIEDPFRFGSSRTLGAYLGLRPGRRQSGGRDPELGISREGDCELRRHLVQAAHYVLGPFGPDSDLRRWGHKLVARGGKAAKKRAVVAVARKLAVLLHRLWVTAEEYEPLREHHHRRTTLPASA